MIDEKMTSIGILSSEENNATSHIIKEIFTNSGFELIYTSRNKVINIFSKENDYILISEITSKTIDSIANLGLDYDIIIQTSLEENYENLLIKRLVRDAKYIVMNIDDKDSRYILDKEMKGIIITYGLNKKATITASSLTISNNVQFNLCIQREYESIKGEKIEPMEMPILMDLVGGSNIYYGLAAIGCGMIYGISIEEIVRILSNIKGMYRYIEKIYDEEYTIIDSSCNSPSDYNLVLKEIQNLKFNNIYIINGIEIDQGIYTIKKNIEKILNWEPVLGIGKVFLYIDKKERLIKKNIDLLFTNKNINYEIFFELENCITSSIKVLGKSDLLLILGSDLLGESRKFINQLA